MTNKLKDHEIAHLVNELRGIATTYANAEQLRSRISECVNNALRNSAPEAQSQDAIGALKRVGQNIIFYAIGDPHIRDGMEVFTAPLSLDHSGGGGMALPERAHFEEWRDRRNAMIADDGGSSSWYVTQAHYATWEACLDKVKELNQ